MDGNMRAELCEQALESARLNHRVDGSIVHSDRGSPLTSRTFRTMPQRRRLTLSMRNAGLCYDNARMESFFAALKKENFYRMDAAELSRTL